MSKDLTAIRQDLCGKGGHMWGSSSNYRLCGLCGAQNPYYRTDLKAEFKESETTPCTFCLTPTTFLGTRHCDRCHELWTRINHDLSLAKTMISAIEMRDKVSKL